MALTFNGSFTNPILVAEDKLEGNTFGHDLKPNIKYLNNLLMFIVVDPQGLHALSAVFPSVLSYETTACRR